MSWIDLSTIAVYLIITVIVGIYYGRNIKSFKEFAVGNQRFSLPVLTMTVFASLIGGNSTVGTIEKVYSTGAIFCLVALGYLIYKIIIALFVVPKFAGFKKAISLGDLMETRFGRKGKLIAGFSVLLLSMGSVGAQVTAMGILSHSMIGVPFEIGVILATSIVVLYSAYGGVNAVVKTDVMQFAVLIVAIPMMCVVGLQKVGGYQVLFSSIPSDFFTIKDPSHLSYISLFFVYCIPTLGPSVIQRLFLSKDSKTVEKSFIYSAIIDAPFTCIIFLLALIALSLNPHLDSQNSFPYLIQSLLPEGLRGVAAVGIMSIIMSTADTALNSTTVFIVNDVIKPLRGEKASLASELLISRYLTVFIGAISLIAALYYKNVFEVYLFAKVFWMPVILFPIYAVIFNLPGNINDFYRASVSGITTYLIWKYYLEDFTYINALLPGFIMNATVFLRGNLREILPKKVKTQADYFLAK